MKSFQGKRILLLYARFFGYDAIVKAKLEELGAIVDLYDARANINSIEKAIRKIYSGYYFKKQRQFHGNIQIRNADKKYDFIFCNDVLDESILKQYRELYPRASMVLYMDDSVKNMKGIEKTFRYYDRVLTFDKKDSETYNIVFRPLFFSDVFQNNENETIKTGEEYDISFVGTCHSDRLNIINKIRDNYPDLKFFFFCYLQSWFMYYYHYLFEKEYRKVSKQFFKFHSMSINDVASIMRRSKCVLDIQHPDQTGLTMRTIETVGSKKKIITTNKDIINYDFYDPSNILIIDRNNPQINREFIRGPFHGISESIRYKYTLAGWLEEIFQL